jgi:hypothetical protein
MNWNVSFSNNNMIIDYSDRFRSVTCNATKTTTILRDGNVVKRLKDITVTEFMRQQELIMAEAKKLEKFKAPELQPSEAFESTN